jgi:hypothetical protein
MEPAGANPAGSKPRSIVLSSATRPTPA